MSKLGIWNISRHHYKGKFYINGVREHHSNIDILLYDLQELKDLAAAIILFEEEENKKDSVMGIVEKVKAMREEEEEE